MTPRTALLLVLLVASACAAKAAPVTVPEIPPDVALAVRPRFCHEPGAAWVFLTIERHPDNRAFLLVLDGPRFYRATARELDGAHAARIFAFLYESLPGGDYTVVVIVQRARGTRRARSDLRVIPRLESLK